MASIIGTGSSEVITGTRFRDIIEGLGGDDLISGRGGNDDLYGGSGNDELYGNSGADYIWGGTGVNDLWGGVGADRFIMSDRGNAFSDDWVGDFEFGADQIDVSDWGVSDFSQLDALLRTDAYGDAYINAYFNGYNHFITIAGVSAGALIEDDFIYANPGALNESGTLYDDVMFGSGSSDVLAGRAGNDILLGGGGSDELAGGAGQDDLIGGDGDDLLTGGMGKDILTGDAGADIFDFNKTGDSLLGARSDVITDFEQSIDVIDLSGIDADAGTAGNQSFNFIATANFSAAGQLRFENAGGRTFIYGNTDADLDAEFRIIIDGIITPTVADFIV